MELFAGQLTKQDARPPLTVPTYTLDKAFISYQGEHPPPIVLCQHTTHGSHF